MVASRKIACLVAFVPMMLAATALQAQDAACRAQAEQFVELAPNLRSQTGIGSGAELIADIKGRWGLAASTYAYSAEQLLRGNKTTDWRSRLIVADGLLGCFDADTRARPEYRDVATEFAQRYPQQERERLLLLAVMP